MISSQAPQALVAEDLQPGNKSPPVRHTLSTQHEDCPHNLPVPEHPNSLPVHSPPIPELDPVQSVSIVPERSGQEVSIVSERSAQEVSIVPERSGQAVSMVHERSGLAVSEIKDVTGKQDPEATPTVSESDSDELEVQTDREEASVTDVVIGPLLKINPVLQDEPGPEATPTASELDCDELVVQAQEDCHSSKKLIPTASNLSTQQEAVLPLAKNAIPPS
jgi:hypothetical protein